MIKKPPRTFASKCPSCGIFCQSHVSFRKQFCVCLFFLSTYELLFFRLSTSDDSCRHRPERQNVFSTMKMDSTHFLTSVKTTDDFALNHMTVCHFYVIILKIFFTPIHWLYFSNCLHVCIFPIVCMHAHLHRFHLRFLSGDFQKQSSLSVKEWSNW